MSLFPALVSHHDSPDAVGDAYQALIADGVLKSDMAQAECVAALDDVRVLVDSPQPGFFARLLGSGNGRSINRGLYIWGDVGRGKTLLMDLFFDAVTEPGKRRVHFHEFMDEVHGHIAEFRQKTTSGNSVDPVPYVVETLLPDTRLLCFDEFHVNDITDAMLLQRLFKRMFKVGIIVVMTSNTEPKNLYRDGLNRQLFLPFIDLLTEYAVVFNLASEIDYRRQKLAAQPVYFFGTPEKTADQIDDAWRNITGGVEAPPVAINLTGRTFVVRRHSMGAARFGFHELCEAPLGARDYLRLSYQFHTIMLENIPCSDPSRADSTRRLILLIDTLYDRGIKLVASFERQLEQLTPDKKTAFDFQRTISRLIEMRTTRYLSRPLKNVAE